MLHDDGGADARWAKAAARAEGVTDLGIGDAVRGYYRICFPVTLLTAAGIAFFITSLWPPASVVVTGVAFTLMLGGLASCVAGLVYGSKKVGPKVHPRRIGVTIGLTAEETKRVRRQILGRDPVDDDLQVLRAAAVQTREGLRRQLLIYPPFMLCLLGQALYRGVTSPLDAHDVGSSVGNGGCPGVFGS